MNEKQLLITRLQKLLEESSAAAALDSQQADEYMKNLKAAITSAQALEVDAKELQDAEKLLKDLKSRGKARDKLHEAMTERDAGRLAKAISKAEEANVPEADLEEARRVLAEEEAKQKARERLVAARDGGQREELKSAIKKAKKAGLDDAELQECNDMLARLESREKAEASLKAAVEERSVAALKGAIAQGIASGVDKALVKKAEKVLEEEERKQLVRDQLAEACRQPTIAALKEAIRAAEAAKLEASETGAAAELLRKEEEKEKVLAEVKQTLQECKEIDTSSIDALREAKEKLGSAIAAAIAAGVAESDLSEAENRRKRLHNTVEDLKGSIRVFCRVRPLSSKETEQGDTQVTKSAGSMGLDVEGQGGGVFNFDAVFTPGTQDEIFADCSDLVQSAVDGYNVTIFAYGQTGAGKTFTMYGCPGHEGVAPRTIQELYRVIALNKSRMEHTVGASMLELYRNDLIDLLSVGQVGASKAKLNVRQEKSGAITVDHLTEETCSSATELSDLLERGSQQRTVAATAMNSESSRSHLVLIVKIKSTNRETGEQLKGKILICDLAGSERLKKSQVTENAQKEAIEINKSLTALGDVIEALTKNEKKIVPYRNHKLTQLMQDSLGGTAKTLMFVNCSPASSNLEETLNALKYATRAKKITNTVGRGC